MKPFELNNRRVLVTGASSGLGREMAVQLARDHHANLVLVARRTDRLQELKAELESAYAVCCDVIAADLSDPAAVDRLYEEATAGGEVHAVVLNAGITHFGKHLELDWAGFQQMLATNVTSVVRLVNLFSPYLIAKKSDGCILLVSSMAGLLPVPYQAAYAGTKAFITNFAQSLAGELHAENISITVFSPGGIDTEMTRTSRLKYFENTLLLQDVESCAADAINAMRLRKSLYVPGFLNRNQLLLSRLVPRSVVGFIARKAYRKALENS